MSREGHSVPIGTSPSGIPAATQDSSPAAHLVYCVCLHLVAFYFAFDSYHQLRLMAQTGLPSSNLVDVASGRLQHQSQHQQCYLNHNMRDVHVYSINKK